MSHHTPEDLRHILLLLKGKQKAGKNIGRVMARSVNRDFYKAYARKGPDILEAFDRAEALSRPVGMVEGDPSPDEEILKLLQLATSAQEAKSKLRARGVGR